MWEELISGTVSSEMPSAEKEKSRATWSALVHNKDINSGEVLDAYKDWATTYETDLLALHPDRAKHVADFLLELCREASLDVASVRVLDVAAGTGLVGVELAKVGFKHVVALDYSQEMLDKAEEKGVYEDFICASIENIVPPPLKTRSFDCVVMLGGFAAGHLPLSSLYTMARICKRGGFLMNSMTLQYTQFVEEYKSLNEYVEELAEEGVWDLKFRKVLDNYIEGKQGLVHAMKVL